MKKQTAEKRKMQTYYEMDQTTPHHCTGCGRCDVPLTHSHLIPQQRLRRINPALIAEPELITYHCHDCHTRFENHDPHLLDFLVNLRIIERYDQEQARFIRGINEL